MLLPLMAITRERQSDYSGWEAGRRGDPCPRLGFYPGLWNLDREYAGCGAIADGRGCSGLSLHPLPFAVLPGGKPFARP